MANESSNRREIDLEASIDFELIKSEIQEKGPIGFSKPNLPIQIFLNIAPCDCFDNDCKNDVIHVERVCGLSRISWLIELKDFLEFENLNTFSNWGFNFGFENSRGERLIMEREIKNLINVPYHQVDDIFCACSACMEAAGEEIVWKNVLLSNMAINLQQRNEWSDWFKDQFEDDNEEMIGFFDDVFDLGYATARMFSEYQLKVDIEASALTGLKAQKDQVKRAEAAGKVSRKKRDQRVVALLSKMEDISHRNPDIARLDRRALADLTMNDAIRDDPDLWKQGKGRRDEYLDEMKADIRYRNRFMAIFG